MRIDINADVGESFGPFTIGDDAAVMRSVSSVSIAAGFHGGDPSVLRRTIALARDLNVAVGVHPSFPDLQGFGRREMRLSSADAEDIVLYQIAAVAGVARAEGVSIAHVKPHGAMYNLAARDRELAEAIARAVFAFDRDLVVYAPPRSALASAARAIGLTVAAEGFPDRGYRADGSLVPRDQEGGVIVTVEEGVNRAMQIAADRTITAVDGSMLSLDVDTLCIHGDTPGAAAMAAWIRAGLGAAGVDVRAPRS
jgi:UPF0271 protein